MPGILFRNAILQTRDGAMGDGWLLVERGKIADVGWYSPPPSGAAQIIDAQGLSLAPGMIDAHVHGALGHDTMDADPDALKEMAQFYAQHGVTGFLPTTMTAPAEAILTALNNIASVRRDRISGAKILGAHVEGPYVDVDKRGCQNEAFVRCADLIEFERWISTGVVRMLTLAPEIPENQALIRYARERGILVAAGHTRASYEEMAHAISWGVSQVTHLYNGMEPLHHREPGAVGAALNLDDLSCQLIADNIHVHPAVLNLTIRIKGTDRVLLVTDAMSGTGQPDGDYDLGGMAVTVRQGVARIASGALAGSTLTMNRALVHIIAATGLPLHRALEMATKVPAFSLGLGNQKGALQVGMDADLILLDKNLDVQLTMVEGAVVFQR